MSADNDSKTSLPDSRRLDDRSRQPVIIKGEQYTQSKGVTRMENVAYYAKHGGRIGKINYYLIGVSVLVCAFVVSALFIMAADPSKSDADDRRPWKDPLYPAISR